MSIPNRDSGFTHIEKLYHSFLRAPHCFIMIYHLVWIDVEIESLSKILATLIAQKSICTMSTLEPWTLLSTISWCRILGVTEVLPHPLGAALPLMWVDNYSSPLTT